MNHEPRFSLKVRQCLILFVLCTMPLAVARGQSATATLSGTVEDQNGAVIPSASVAAINVGTALQRDTTTDSGGNYTFPLLPPGTYIVRVQAQGFATVENRNVVLNVGDQKALRIQLKAGNISEMIQVNADAPLISESPAVGTVVDRQFVGNLPLNGRSFQSLIALTPGVVLTTSSFQNLGQFSVNGQRANANYFTVDGVSANFGVSNSSSLAQGDSGSLPGLTVFGGTNNLVSVDALQEFRIQTSTYAPEFGRTPGAQVSIATRSGTKDFHGTVFDYFRNDALDATDWFVNSNPNLKKPPMRQNDFGGVLGGPLYLPRFGEGGPSFHNGKNRTFFFFSYEGLRLRQPQSRVLTVPSVNARQNAVPAMQPFFNAFPIPNGSDLGNNLAQYFLSTSNPTTLDATGIRVDHTLSSKLSFFARYNHAPSESVNRKIESDTTQAKTQTLTAGILMSLTSSIANDFRANYSRNTGRSFSEFNNLDGQVPVPDSLLFPSPFSTRDSRFAFFAGSAIFVVGKNADNVQRQINLVDTLSVVSGSHQLKFGIDYRRIFPIFDPIAYQQQVIFGSVTAAMTGTASLGVILTWSQTFPIFNNLSLFGQDTWKVSPRLTLTYGARWEVNPPPSEAHGNDPFALTNLDNPAAIALAPRGTPLYKTTYRNIAPRVGVAYQLSQAKGRETVLRGGFGIFYDTGSGPIADAFGNTFPIRLLKILPNAQVPAPLQFPFTAAAAAPPVFNANPPYTDIVAGADPNLKLPYTYQWNVAVEQSLGASQTVSASYVGAAGRRLLGLESWANPNPNFTGNGFIIATRNTANSDYHAMQLQFQRRLSRGLQALASYTWSKSLDNTSSDSFRTIPGTSLDPKIDRGPSDFDVRHTFTAAVTYDLPNPKFGSFGNAIFHNWSLNTIVVARSAPPVNVNTGTNFFNVFGVLRPDLVAGVPLYINDSSLPGGRQINRLAFTTPPAGRQGTLGRNALRGFGAWQVDFALGRQFKLNERVNLWLKAELFNVFNHPNFGSPRNALNSGAAFGKPSSMLAGNLGGLSALYQLGGPRSVQLSLKIGF